MQIQHRCSRNGEIKTKETVNRESYIHTYCIARYFLKYDTCFKPVCCIASMSGYPVVDPETFPFVKIESLLSH